MSSERLVFYGAIFAMACITLLITHCTYQKASCTQEAIKAGVSADNIGRICKMDRW